ncbi:MAG: DUF433 domain-containing protein [Anaerolineae bacterium]
MLAMPTAVNVPLRLDAGDVIRVGNTRVTLQAVVADFQRGASPEEIAHHYTALNLSEVYLVIGYYLQNRGEVDSYVRQQSLLADEMRRHYEADHPHDALRERLLARLDEAHK